MPATVVAPSGMVGTFVSHLTLPVARLSASTSPVGAPLLAGTGDARLVHVIESSMVARYTLSPATAMLVSTPPSSPGAIV